MERNHSKKHYLAEIDYKNCSERWSWDIYIVANENQEYLGKALAPGKGVEIPWTLLGQKDYLGEMIEICEELMPK
ncbi:hypothetical protein [Bacillus suaedae]|uniref:Uncharacterized protein n=1 Tax=Halalkalibacter suaedae TaxID=2822140 RepID=A0A940WY41_9BACI|nr:hypothetical protein [Bacillus suaedae]MBP3950079.1 hypothetical protein [Bacillus suaedae]